MLTAFRAAVSELGFREAVWYGFGRALQRLSGSPILFRYALVAQPVPATALAGRRGKDIDVRILSEPSPALVALEVDPDTQRYRYRQGALCFGAFQRDVPIACLWICLGPYDEDEVRCRFVPLPAGRASWDLGMYVLPAHRSGIAFARVWDEANAYLRQRGVTATLSRIATVNRVSLASHRRLGARPIGSATFFRLGPAQIMMATVRPYIHLSLSPSRRPHLHLSSAGGKTAAVTKDSSRPLG